MKGDVTDTLVVLIHITTTIVQFLATSVGFTPQLLNLLQQRDLILLNVTTTMS